jgi:Rps23 Pro-64 3,4-dihydroxylase Tpa1-like proline 4-hydroxylase
MIYIEDNCLPAKEFELLKNLIQKRYIPFDRTLTVEDAYKAIRLTHHDARGNWHEGVKFLGMNSLAGVEKVIDTFKTLGIPAVNYSLWFAYNYNGTRVKAHRDGPLRRSTREHTYTSLLYTSDWQPGWGGELVFGEPVKDINDKPSSIIPEKIIDPVPNRLVIFSRDHYHEVKKVTAPDQSYVRQALGTGWSSTRDHDLCRNVRDVAVYGQ